MLVGAANQLGWRVWVSASGSDSTGTGTQGNPWKTLQHAADTVRAQGLNALVPVTVQYTGDLWNQTLTLGTADSGSAFNPLTFRATSRTDRLMAATPVTGWSVYSGNIQRAAVSGNFYTMFENGIRGQSARSPEIVVNGTYPLAVEPMVNATGPFGGHTAFTYNPAEIDPTGWNVGDMQVVFFNGYNAHAQWFNDVTPVTAVNTSTHTITLLHETRSPVNLGAPGSKFFIQGCLELLTEAGEWYYDRNDVHGSPGGGLHYLYYWPRATPIASQEILIPTSQDVIRLVGTDDTHVIHDVHFEHMTVAYSDFGAWFRYGTAFYDSPLPLNQYWPTEQSLPETLHGLVFATNAENIGFDGVHLTGSGFDGIFAYQHCKYFRMLNVDMDHIGLNGFHCEGVDPILALDVNGSHVVSNYRCRYFGELGFHGGGIWLANSGQSNFEHMEIAFGMRQAIGYQSNGTYAQFYTKGNSVWYAYIHDVCQDSGDTGAIDLVALSSVAGSGLYNVNYFNQIIIDNANAHPSMLDNTPYGFFLDVEAANQVLRNIEVRNTTGAALGVAGSSTGGTIVNVGYTGAINTGLMDYANIGLNFGTWPWG